MDGLNDWVFNVALPEYRAWAEATVVQAVEWYLYSIAGFALAIVAGLLSRSFYVLYSCTAICLLSISLISYLLTPTMQYGIMALSLSAIFGIAIVGYMLHRQVQIRGAAIRRLTAERDLTKKRLDREIEWRRAADKTGLTPPDFEYDADIST